MSDWQTLRQTILEEIGKPADTTLVDRAIAEAIEFVNDSNFFWNEAPFSFTTTAGVNEYQLPKDFIGLIGTVYFERAGNVYSRRPMQESTVDFVATYKYNGLIAGIGDVGIAQSYANGLGGLGIGVHMGPPSNYAVSIDKLYLAPIPNQDGDIISGRYIKDIGTPKVVYNGSTWAIQDPDDNSKTITGTWTNRWFTDGFHLIRTKAEAILFKRNYENPEMAAQMDQEFEAILSHHMAKSNRRRGRKKIRGYFL